MTLDEYIDVAKRELDEMANKYRWESAADPEGWPLEMDEDEWAGQEADMRGLR